jgi:hypothetical protein
MHSWPAEHFAGAAAACRGGPTRTQVADMYKQVLLTVGMVLALLLSSQHARTQAPGLIANEKWICTEKVASGAERKPVEYTVVDGALIEQPLGLPRYKLLSNTAYGLIGVDHSTDLELGYVDVFVATVMIDRMNGNFAAMTATSGGTPEARTGQCRMISTSTLGPTARK